MIYKKLKPFGSNFFWSAATAAYQCEGAYLEDGKGLSIVDINTNPKFSNTSVTSDHYHKYKEDVALMKELGLKAYRFSLSWPRIINAGERKVNQKGIDFYNRLIDELIKNHIEPLVTIYHFDLPLVLQEKYGGWASREILDDFSFFCATIFRNFGDRVKYWFTINEQSNMFALPYLMAFDPDSKKSIEQQKFQMNHIMTIAHAKAITLCREMIPDAKIGPAIGLSPYYPASENPDDVLACRTCEDFKTYLFMELYFKGEYKPNIFKYMHENDLVPDIQDGDMELIKSARPNLLGLNYYQSVAVKYAPLDAKATGVELDSEGKKSEEYETVPGMYQIVKNRFLEKTLWGWEIDPTGLRILLNDIYERYKVPVIITENGIGAQEELGEDNKVRDSYRIDYLNAHIKQMQLAITDGVDVIGYCPWSFMDLLSTTSGFGKRYGFVYVNRTDADLKDLARYKKDSFFWYKSFIENNS